MSDFVDDAIALHRTVTGKGQRWNAVENDSAMFMAAEPVVSRGRSRKIGA